MLRWLIVAASIYAAYAALVFALQRRITFPGAYLPPEAAHVPPPNLSVQMTRIDTGSGMVDAWFMGPSRGGGRVPALIHTHGNAELLGGSARQLARFAREGFAVLMVEYPGYGISEGTPSRESIRRSMVAAYDWLTARDDIDPEAIVGMGRSLGTGAISDLSLERPLAAIIYQSPYTRAAEFAAQYLLPPIIVRDDFDNLAAATAFAGPVLVFHGIRDPVVPYEQGVKVAQAARRATLITWDCGHNDCPPDWRRFTEQTIDFLVSSEVAPQRLFRSLDLPPPDDPGS